MNRIAITSEMIITDQILSGVTHGMQHPVALNDLEPLSGHHTHQPAHTHQQKCRRHRQADGMGQ